MTVNINHNVQTMWKKPSCSLISGWVSLIFLGVVEDPENVEEEVDDVQVQLDGRQDVFLGWEPMDDHVRVVDEEQGENDGSADAHGYLQVRIPEEQLEIKSDETDKEKYPGKKNSQMRPTCKNPANSKITNTENNL